jgi:hypothetical protein
MPYWCAERRPGMSDVAQLPLYGPKSLGQILDRVVHLLRANLKLLLGISAVPPVVLILSLGLSFCAVMLPVLSQMPRNPSPAQESRIAAVFFTFASVAFILYGATFAPSIAAASRAAVKADLGERITFREAYGSAFQRYGRNLLLLLLISLVAMGPMILVQMIAFAGSVAIGRNLNPQGPAFFVGIPASILLLLACFVFSILAMLRLSLAFSACVTEHLTAVAAIKRSNYLTRDASGRIFVVLLIIYAIIYAVFLLGMFAAWLVFTVGGLIPSGSHYHVLPAVRVLFIACFLVGLFAVGVLYMALNGAGYATALAVIYNDQRLRFEGPRIPLAG